MRQKLLSIGYLLLWCFQRGLWLHTKLVALAVAAVIVR